MSRRFDPEAFRRKVFAERDRLAPLLPDIDPADLRIASLEDIIKSKAAAGRQKDALQLPMLPETLRVNRALAKK